MSTSTSTIPHDPYLEYDAQLIAGMAAACAQCGESPPCTQACSHAVAIPTVMHLAGQAACEGLALTRWLMTREAIETARVTDAIADCYNG
jgi:NADPH-dependent glutamate synthase beta subunit-like oxidoreductase